jgi:hypothetical protein
MSSADHEAVPMASGVADAIGTAARPTREPTVELLAGGQSVEAAAGEVTVAIGRAVLPSGEIAPHRVRRAELLAVEAGGLALTAGKNGTWVRRGTEGRSVLADTAILGPGEGALVRCCGMADYRSTAEDPLVLLLITITPTA